MMEETSTAPPLKLDIEQLFRLQDTFMNRLLQLSHDAVTGKNSDPVTMHVNLVKIAELQGQIKAEWNYLNTIINHP